ncbi:PQQ-binding-like beta-propeller repeat protein [Jatrophihabitans sp.]|uniref:outer membrane protein assembly factor BamB family protein n=1 Tax=Jatrophihabitans sp. TaxID=1932789 RepID=UPI002C1AA7C7|nr:PQQ-binding-like beta-propeller repeat protein [Jatrophihabitans sp.]
MPAPVPEPAPGPDGLPPVRREPVGAVSGGAVSGGAVSGGAVAGGGPAGDGGAGDGGAGDGGTRTAPAGPPVSPALADYQARTARSMRIYAVVLAVLLLAVVLAVRVAYARGELTHVTSHSAPAPAAVPSGSTADSLALAWRSSDRPAGGTPVQDGVVVSYDAHSVHGLDARTGKLRWYYTRSDQTICSVLQQDATTIAIYDRHGNCDEVTGFVSATGAVKWSRTMTDNGITEAASAPNVVLTVARYSVHVIDNAGGLDRWNWVAPDRCSVDRALAGSQGVLISTTCGSEHRLVLRGLTSDELKWSVTVPRAMVPVAASAFLGAVDPDTGILHSYSDAKGADTPSGQLGEPAELRGPLAGLPRAATAVEGFTSSGQQLEVLWLGKLYSFARSGTISWSAPASGPATVQGPDVLAAAGGSTVQRLDGRSGQPAATVALSPELPAGYRAFGVGNGLLLAGTDTRMYQ